MSSLLIIEDDDLLRDGLCTQLAQEGHQVATAADGEQAQHLLESERFDGVILDLSLPKRDGMDILQWSRKRSPALPILILTARDSVDDRVQGLKAGADDYMTKPFNMQELQARLASLLRRARLPAFTGSLEIGATAHPVLRVDAQLPRAWLGDHAMELTQREWSLLSLLVRHAGQVVSRDDVVSLWQIDGTEGGLSASNALEVYIHRLRRKLQGSGLNIRNVRGLGYLFETKSP